MDRSLSSSRRPFADHPRFATCVFCLIAVSTSIVFGEPPAARTEFMGRQIAQTMHYSGAEWLARDNRELEERCSLMLANLGVKPGMTVCDMGCGNGIHTLRLAEMVGPRGRVLAVDVQSPMLDLLRERINARDVNNVTPILGSFHDPRLPAASVDLMLLVDVYHEFSHPKEMLDAMRRSLAPAGRMVLVEFRAEDPKVPIQPVHKMSKEQILREIPAHGFELIEEFNGLPWQHMMFFGVKGEP
ncbi:MAG: class I SAM-dependent methyltransferase [Planctomycetes bacterium]|nr:class I SAM-dependent methyltransferase [Planctomycetota bacterium]